MVKEVGKFEAFQLMSEENFEQYDNLVKHFDFHYDVSEGQQIFEYDEQKKILYVTLIAKTKDREEIKNKISLDVAKKVGRPSLGTTKKVSLTLPDEIWTMIEERKNELGFSQSQTLRMMIEGYFYRKDE